MNAENKGNLIISRKAGEVVCIGDNVKVTVLSIDGNKVKLALDAPKSVPILRKELLDRKNRIKEIEERHDAL